MEVCAAFQEEAQTTAGKLYIVGTLAGSCAIVSTFISLVSRYRNRTQSDFFLTVTPLLLALGFYLKVPYLENKLLSKLTLVVWGTCWLLIYVATLICNQKAKQHAA